jgi:hypothetical protein
MPASNDPSGFCGLYGNLTEPPRTRFAALALSDFAGRRFIDRLVFVVVLFFFMTFPPLIETSGTSRNVLHFLSQWSRRRHLRGNLQLSDAPMSGSPNVARPLT